jgi:glycosyltransferase involved in cell wall biosynthesis
MVFAEAWLRRLPVVGNRWCGPVASLIGEGRDGFLASGAADLADALGRLLDDEALRRAMGEAGREKTLRDHTWPSCASRAASALRECVFAG